MTTWSPADEVQHVETFENSAHLTEIEVGMPEPGIVEVLSKRFPNTGNMANLKFLANQMVDVAFPEDEDDVAPGVLFAMGGHVIKTGCGPIIADLANRGFITAMLVNGSWLIHDVEMALYGETSEHVDKTIAGGRYGFTIETVSVFGEAFREAAKTGRFLFDCLGAAIRDRVDHVEPGVSVIAHMTDDKTRIGDKIPVFTAHALGTDTIHNHPSLDWSTIGEVAQHEFGMLLDYFMDKMNGGIWANVGSAVILPEIFLKTIAAAANISKNRTQDARLPMLDTVAVLDMLEPYRARTSVLGRGSRCGADSEVFIRAPHEFTLPLLRECILATISNRDAIW